MDSASIPALSIAIIENGRILWNDGWGMANKENNHQANANTIFQGASLGKPIFAYAVLKLCDEGKLDLDKPLTHYAPGDYIQKHFLRSNIQVENFKNITARMVLSHSSGLPNWRTEEGIKLLFNPGEKYSYSGEGYYYLQIIIEHLTSLSIEEWMQKTVFRPLTMNHTSYLNNKKDRLAYSVSYDASGKADSTFESVRANVAHSLRTTATDYALFLIALMDSKGLKKKSFDSFFSGQIKTDICRNESIFWALGTAVQQSEKGNVFFQWGKNPFASAYVIGFNEQKSAVVYFTNVANQGLRIGEKLIALTLKYKDPLFGCFGVQQYDAGKHQ